MLRNFRNVHSVLCYFIEIVGDHVCFLTNYITTIVSSLLISRYKNKFTWYCTKLHVFVDLILIGILVSVRLSLNRHDDCAALLLASSIGGLKDKVEE